MTTEDLESLSRTVAEALAEREALSPTERAELGRLRRAITVALERTEETDEEDSDDHDVLERLRGRVEKLEREHPDLVALVDRVARALSNAGI